MSGVPKGRLRAAFFVSRWDGGVAARTHPSVPGMGMYLIPERWNPEDVTTTVANPKVEAARPD